MPGKHKSGLLLAGILAITAMPVHGSKKPEWEHKFTVGLEAQHYHYKEPRATPVPGRGGWAWMSQTGYNFGVNGEYRLTYMGQWFMQPELRFLMGRENYEMGEPGFAGNKLPRNTPNWLLETRVVFGGHIPINSQWKISPYAGIGFRKKVDDGEGNNNEMARCMMPHRKSHYVYLPVGSYLEYEISPQWGASLRLEYDHLIKGWQYSRRKHRYVHPLNFNQHSGYGLKAELMARYKSKDWSVSFGPYLNYWKIKQSDDGYRVRIGLGGRRYPGYAHEPWNISYESGLRLSVSM